MSMPVPLFRFARRLAVLSLLALTAVATARAQVAGLTGTLVVEGVVRHAVPTEASRSHMVGVTADGTRGYPGNMGDHTVSELDLTTHRTTRALTTGSPQR